MQNIIRIAATICLVLSFWLSGVVHPVAASPLFTNHPILPLALFHFSGQRPDNLGAKAGQLASCPSTPNCVSSQSTDTQHYIKPLELNSNPKEAIAKLKAVVQNLPRTKVIAESENYLYVEFTSAFMGYVDDVEFYVNPAQNAIEVRSASRLGESDLGVNRDRIETIRSRWAA